MSNYNFLAVSPQVYLIGIRTGPRPWAQRWLIAFPPVFHIRICGGGCWSHPSQADETVCFQFGEMVASRHARRIHGRVGSDIEGGHDITSGFVESPGIRRCRTVPPRRGGTLVWA